MQAREPMATVGEAAPKNLPTLPSLPTNNLLWRSAKAAHNL